MNQILQQYPESVLDTDQITIPVYKDVQLWIKLDCSEFYAWDTKRNDYTSVLNSITQQVLHLQTPSNHNDYIQSILLIAQQFRDSFSHGKIAGYDITSHEETEESESLLYTLPRYDASQDFFWSKMKKKYHINPDRPLKIYTYGTTYLFQAPEGTEKIFNAAVMRGSSDKRSFTRKMLIKLRGTDPELQYEIREAVLFESFVEGVIETVEKEDLKVIAIICRAGHHRSVAVAEMLIHVYSHLTLEHLTIDH